MTHQMRHEVVRVDLPVAHIASARPQRVHVRSLLIGVNVAKSFPSAQKSHHDFFERLLIVLRSVALVETSLGLDVTREVGLNIHVEI